MLGVDYGPYILVSLPGFFAILVVFVTQMMQGRSRRIEHDEARADAKLEKEQERADREAVQQQAEEAARLLKDSNAEVAATLVAANADTNAQLGAIKVVADQTHLLVNSNMMKEMRRGLAYAKALLVSLERDTSGSLDDEEAILVLKREIDDTEKSLHELERRTEEATAVADVGVQNAGKD